MNSQTRIIVIRQKYLLYLAVCLAIILLLGILIMVTGKDTGNKESTTEYVAGVYSSTIVLNGNPVDIQVIIDTDKIHSIGIVNTTESIATMYPMFGSCFDDIKNQVIAANTTENIVYSPDNRYTSIVITNAIEEAIKKAIP